MADGYAEERVAETLEDLLSVYPTIRGTLKELRKELLISCRYVGDRQIVAALVLDLYDQLIDCGFVDKNFERENRSYKLYNCHPLRAAIGDCFVNMLDSLSKDDCPIELVQGSYAIAEFIEKFVRYFEQYNIDANFNELRGLAIRLMVHYKEGVQLVIAHHKAHRDASAKKGTDQIYRRVFGR